MVSKGSNFESLLCPLFWLGRRWSARIPSSTSEKGDGQPIAGGYDGGFAQIPRPYRGGGTGLLRGHSLCSGSNVPHCFQLLFKSLTVYYSPLCVPDWMARAIDAEAVVGKKFSLLRTRRYVSKDSPPDALVRLIHRGMR